jgi:hypothetical protein
MVHRVVPVLELSDFTMDVALHMRHTSGQLLGWIKNNLSEAETSPIVVDSFSPTRRTTRLRGLALL